MRQILVGISGLTLPEPAATLVELAIAADNYGGIELTTRVDAIGLPFTAIVAAARNIECAEEFRCITGKEAQDYTDEEYAAEIAWGNAVTDLEVICKNYVAN